MIQKTVFTFDTLTDNVEHEKLRKSNYVIEDVINDCTFTKKIVCNEVCYFNIKSYNSTLQSIISIIKRLTHEK